MPPLLAGTRIGVYELGAAVGRGGMGEVYRAHDTKLNRDIALKVLLPEVSDDPERLARFRREAQILASLNHPNIAHIYGLEESDGVVALVLELVDGETLADRIARGPIPLDDALPIARQIAEALEAAHEQGIIHRDLKPANIKVRDDGTVKVLDFGLAKALEPTVASGSAAAPTNSPTITSPALMTGVGTLLGTAAYMSPEQAKGKPADTRSDIWAFGCVLYEMLTGKRAFDGEDVADTLAFVLTRDPDWNALPPNTPSLIRGLLRRCLERNGRRRIKDPSTILFSFDQAEAPVGPQSISVPVVSATARRRPAVLVAALVGAAAIGALVVWQMRPSTMPARVTRFVVTLPDDQPITSLFYEVLAVSPDGTQLVYSAGGRLYLRSMSELQARPIPGTESGTQTAAAVASLSPVFSPDGRWLAFFADRTLKKVAVAGGIPVTLCPVEGNPLGMTWSAGGIFFGAIERGIVRVSEAGGTPEVVVPIPRGQLAYRPQLLPDRKTVLFTLASGTGVDRWDRAQIVAQSLSSGERRVIGEGSAARYVPTGHLLYALRGVLYGAPFDAQRLQLTGPGVPLIEGVRRAGLSSGAAHFSVSESGAVAYLEGPITPSFAEQRLAFIDRRGTSEPLGLQAGPYQYPRVSPDGRRVAFGTDDGNEANVWIYDVSVGGSPKRLTFGGHNRLPVWSSDGQSVAFQSDRQGDEAIYRQPIEGGGVERLTDAPKGSSHTPQAWSPTGDTLLFSVRDAGAYSLWVFSFRDHKAVSYDAVRSELPISAAFSPDGKWVAYSQRDAHQGAAASNVFVQPFPPTGETFQISNDSAGSHLPLWAPDGSELFYVGGNRTTLLTSVSIRTTPRFVVGTPRPVPRGFAVLGPGLAAGRTYDITPDGRRFVGLIDPLQVQAGAAVSPAPKQIVVVLDWFGELLARVPTN
jgi:serine/threonine-protein kinase